jgi:hypothetical protein
VRTGKPAQRLYEIFGAALGLAALVLQFVITIGLTAKNGMSLAGGIVFYFSFFTILSNILVVLSYGAPLAAPTSAPGRFFARGSVKSAIALYILIVGLVYFAVLRHTWQPQGWQLVADAALHYATPVLYLVYWLAFVDKTSLGYRAAAPWLAFPVAYCVYALARGALVGLYPYPFLEANKIGYGQVAVNILALVALFTAFGLLIVTAGRALARRARA